MRSRRLWLGLILGSLTLGLWAWWNSVDHRRGLRELEIAKNEIEARHHARARERLLPLTRSSRLRDEAFYQIGVCDEARGRRDLALGGGGEVPLSSRFAVKAAMARARILANTGKFAEAEELLSSIPWRREP